MKNKQRYFPKGSVKVTPKNLAGVEIGLYDYTAKGGQPRVGAIVYSGKRNTHDFYEVYQTPERREQRITEYLKRLEQNVQSKLDRAENRVLKVNPVKVGDIFYTSWGHEQTNVEFFQVVDVKGSYCWVREICSQLEDGGRESGMSSNVSAIKDSFVENAEVIRKKICTYDGGKSVHLSFESYKSAWLWDGRPKYSSWYA